MGARALGLGPGGQYAIHGTNVPASVGSAASYGCFRMHNRDVIDLYGRVRIGTPVIVMR
jgi:lipoprotein-anchoring transpeptidase ErfK/SrfK